MINTQTIADSWRDWWGRSSAAPRGPHWLQWFWTVLVSADIAICYSVLVWLAAGARMPYGSTIGGFLFGNFVVALTISIMIRVLIGIGVRVAGVGRLDRFTRLQRRLFFNGLALLGVLAGLPLGLLLIGGGLSAMPTSAAAIGPLAAITVLGTLLLMVAFSTQARQAEERREATEARLKLLQAQIEPHFLFNTLATVASLIDSDAPKAKQMLETFVEYLRASLGHLRGMESTLGEEIAMAEAYLKLMQLRMQDRLRFAIDVGSELRGVALPPLLLQPLVENAIHHGLEPKIEGGRVTISARLHEGRLRLMVSDDGLGPTAPPRLGARRDNGLALENLRARLASKHGAAASLVLQPLHPGTAAVLTLPCSP